MRRDSLALLAALALASGVMMACGGDDDGPPPSTGGKPGKTNTTPPKDFDAFTDQYATTYCSASSACCKEKGSTASADDCHDYIASQLVLIRNTASAKYDQDTGTACITKLKALVGKSAACTTLDKGVDECNSLLTVEPPPAGGKAPGETCTSSDECQPPADGEVRCEEVGFGATLKKICQHVLAGTASTTPCVGDSRQTITVNEDAKLAVGTVYRCGDGLRCDASTRNCVPSGAAGADCDYSFDCTTGTYCNSGKCAAAVADGASCTENFMCAAASFCSSKGACAPYVAPGAACTSGDPDSRCKDGACVNGACSSDEAESGSKLVCTP